jgi:hypothetical protein
MRRMHLVALLGLSLAIGVRAGDPQPQVASKPPWQRLLTGDTARKAAELDKRIEEQEEADHYAEAIAAAEELLALRIQKQGADHWETASEKWMLAARRKVAALPAEKRFGWRKAGKGMREADRLEQQARYAQALPLRQQRLAWCREVLGENHPLTANSYNSLAASLNVGGRYAEAGPLFQKALAIFRRALGEDHPQTAMGYNNLAHNLQAQGRNAEAGPLFQKSLDIRRQALGEGHPRTAISYSSLAGNLNVQGRYAEAGPLLQKALDIRLKALGEDHPDTAQSYNNVAFTLDAQGRNAEAEPLHQKALAIFRQALGEDHPRTATSYHNSAVNLHAQGKYAEALVALVRATRSFDAARLGVAAAGLDRAAFAARSSPYVLLAAGRARAGQQAEAWATLETGLGRGLLDELTRRRGAGLTSAEQGERDRLRARRGALERRILALVSRPRRTDAEAQELAGLLDRRRELEEALAGLAAAVSRREVATLRQLQAALPQGAAFLAWADVAPVQEHWGCVVRPRGEPHWERLPGSGPGERWTWEDNELPQRLRSALARSAPEAEILALARKLHAQRLAPLEKHLAGVKRILVLPVNAMAGLPLEVLTDQYTISYTPSGTFLAKLPGRPQPRSSGVLAVGDPLFPPAREAAKPVSLPPGGLLLTQVVPGGAADGARLRPGDVLVAYAGQDLTSIEQLGKLIAAQAGARSVPVRVWREGQPKPAERELPPGRLGVVLAKQPAREYLTARREADRMLARLQRGGDFAELPGTQVEIARLAVLFDAQAVTKLTRAAASEERLDELRRAGELKKYRYLHLATHGQANDDRAFDSALLLTRPRQLPEPRPGEPYLDGRLTAAEVLEFWQLDAELVTLSACESGLGRKGGGEGLLGFAQAFLLAGSRAVLLTLWQVDDTATALLMDRFYKNLLGKREDGAKALPKAEALREAKQWLRSLTAKEALDRLGVITQGVVRGPRPARQEMRPVPRPENAPPDYRPYAHPRYWAAFILIGDPG